MRYFLCCSGYPNHVILRSRGPSMIDCLARKDPPHVKTVLVNSEELL